MTNANLPERWLNDMRFRRKRLSDSGYRSYMQALMWSVANRTEGYIERGDLEDIPDFNPADVRELVKDGLWEAEGERWLIYDFATTQTGKDLLEKYEREKALDRARKARQRAEAAAAKRAALAGSGGSSGGQSPTESPSTDQNKPIACKGRTEKNATDPDKDYADDYADWVAEDTEDNTDNGWCTPQQRAHYDSLADRALRDGYDR
jgi:hypothetical protein